MKLPGFNLLLVYAITLFCIANQEAADQHRDFETYEAAHNLTSVTFHRQGQKLMFLPWSVRPALQRFFTKLTPTSRHRRRRAVLSIPSPQFYANYSNTTRQLEERIQIVGNVSLQNVSEVVENVKLEQNNLDVINDDESNINQNKTSNQNGWSFSNNQETNSGIRTLYSVTHGMPPINETSSLENKSLVLHETRDVNENKSRLRSDNKMLSDAEEGTALGESNTSFTDGLMDAGEKNDVMKPEKMRYTVDEYAIPKENHVVQDDMKRDTTTDKPDRSLGNEKLQDDTITNINNENDTMQDAELNSIHHESDSLQKDDRPVGQDEKERDANAKNAVMRDNNTRDTTEESVSFRQNMMQNDEPRDTLNVDVSRGKEGTIPGGVPQETAYDRVLLRHNVTTQDDNNYDEDILDWQNDLMKEGHTGHDLEENDPLRQNNDLSQDDEPRDTVDETIPLGHNAETFQEDDNTRDISDDGVQDDNTRDTSDDGARHQNTRRRFTMPPPPPPPLPGFGFLATMQELVLTVKDMFKQQEQDRQRIRFLEHHLRSVVSNLKDVHTKAADSQKRTRELQDELNDLDGRMGAVQQTLDQVQENQTRCFHLLRVFNNSSKELEAKVLRLSHMCNSCLATTADKIDIQSYLRAHWTLEVDFARVASNVRTLSTTVKDLQDKVSSLVQLEQPSHNYERTESEVSRDKNHIKRDMLYRKDTHYDARSDIPVVQGELHRSSTSFLEGSPSTTTPLKLPYNYGTESDGWSDLKSRQIMLPPPRQKTDDEKVTTQEHYSRIHTYPKYAGIFLELREQPEDHILGTAHVRSGTQASPLIEKFTSLQASPLLNVYQSSVMDDHERDLEHYVSSVKHPYYFTKSPSLVLETSFSSLDVKFPSLEETRVPEEISTTHFKFSETGEAAEYFQPRVQANLNSHEEGSHLISRESQTVNLEISPSQSPHLPLSRTQPLPQRPALAPISASDPALTNSPDQTLTKKPDPTLTRKIVEPVQPSLSIREASSEKWGFQLTSEINGGFMQHTQPDIWKDSSLPNRHTSYLGNHDANKTEFSSSIQERNKTLYYNKDLVETTRSGSLRHEELITTQQDHPHYSLPMNSVTPELPTDVAHELHQLSVGHGQDIRQLEDRIQILENLIFELASNKTSLEANDTYEKRKSYLSTSVELDIHEYGSNAQSQIFNLSNTHDTKEVPSNDSIAVSGELQRRQADVNDLRQMVSKMSAIMTQWKDEIGVEGSNRSTIARTGRKVSKLQERVRNLQLTSKRWFQHLKGHVIRLNNSLQDLQERVEFQTVVQSDQIKELRDVILRAGKDQIAKDEATQARHANVSETLQSLSQDVGILARETNQLLAFIPKDCHDYFNLGFYKSGVYPIKPDTFNQTVSVFCLMDISKCRLQGHQVDCHQRDADGNNTAHQERSDNNKSQENNQADDSSRHLDSTGGWTILQRRTIGQLNFTRTWAEYSRGFGDVNQEFWVGNDFIHRISLQRDYQLRVVIQDAFSRQWESRYDKFRVLGEDSKYKLVIGGFQGNATDGLGLLNQAEFSTFDWNRQVLPSHCAPKQGAGWWYNQCHVTNLNGPYSQGMVWYNRARRDWVLLKSSVMMIKPLF